MTAIVTLRPGTAEEDQPSGKGTAHPPCRLGVRDDSLECGAGSRRLGVRPRVTTLMPLEPGESSREAVGPIECSSIRTSEVYTMKAEAHVLLPALTCLLFASNPVVPPVLHTEHPELLFAPADSEAGASAEAAALDLRASTPPQHLDLARAPLLPQLPGSGDGDHQGHSEHMSSTWIVMGGMMAVMMVGAGAYYMSHRATAGGPTPAPILKGPAAYSVPVPAPSGG